MSLSQCVRPSKALACRTLSSCTRVHSLKARNAPLDIHPEVEEALAHNKPVVALETALVSHGLPFPSSLNVPLALEEIVRSSGAIPATIGIIGGRVKVGMERGELSRLAEGEPRGKAAKISRRDIAAAIAMGADGGTTCSATLVFAALAGIKVFATGGLGGVHRGGENSMDVSADLQELTRCPVGLVSSGVKSILDIKRTLEYLESLGVPVLSYGKSREFPAFFSRHSGYTVPWNVDNPLTAAKLLYTQAQLGMQNGALIAVPIPEEYEAAGEQIQKFVNQAVLESEENGVSKSGKDATPWLLNRIAELSNGKSLISNIALLENTALVGGQIAVEYQKLVNESLREKSASQSSFNLSTKSTFASPVTTKKSIGGAVGQKISTRDEPATAVQAANVVIVGSAAVDITAQESAGKNPVLAVHSTAPGHVRLTLGGVGRNIAEAAHRVMQAKCSGLSSLLIAPIGADQFGHLLVEELKAFGMRTDGLIKTDKPTAVCNMVLDSNGTLVGGVADMGITESTNPEDFMRQVEKHNPSIIAFDGNLHPAAMEAIVLYANGRNISVLFEPTSTIKCTGVLPAIMTALRQQPDAAIAYATPNLLELTELYETSEQELFEVPDHPYHPYWWSVIDSLGLGSAFRNSLERMARFSDGKINLGFLLQEGIIQKAINLLPLFQHLVVKCGDQGVLIVMRLDPKTAATSGWAGLSNPDQRVIVSKGNAGELLIVQHISPLPVESLANVTGAGDSFVGALLATLAQDPTVFHHPKTLRNAILTSQKAAVLTLQSHHAVSPLLSELSQA